MEYIELFKIGGLAGVALFFFYLIVKLVIRQPTKMHYVVLIMAFILTFFALFIFWRMQFNSDGGKQLSSRVAVNEQVLLTSLNQNECHLIKKGEFSIWLSFNADKPY